MWRNLTLSAPSSAKEYIVWEYPIREIYIHINSVIEKTEYVENYEAGLKRVIIHEYFNCLETPILIFIFFPGNGRSLLCIHT